MNKQELISEIANKAGLNKRQAGAALDTFIDSVKSSLRRGDDVRLVGFGTFQVKRRSGRKGRNPRTKQVINIPAKKVPAFRASSQLKELVNH